MKVLHILNELNPSGAEAMLYSSSSLLKDYGITAEILSTGSQSGRYAKQLTSAGYLIHHIPFAKNLLFFLKLFRLLKINNYDVVHLHTERANFWLGIIALITAERCIRTIHSNFPFTGFLGWKRKLQRLLLHKLGVIHVAISPSVQNTEYQYYKLPVQVIPNWYNSLHFVRTTEQQRVSARQELGIPENCFVLVSVGNCSPVKNHSALIEAIAQIEQNNICYLHIGIEKDHSEQELAINLGIDNLIQFKGMQTNILPYLQAADLFVMPSTYEGFGIAALEAISTGLPALLSHVPGLLDFNAEFAGLFYCDPTPRAIADKLSEIIAVTQKELRQQCASNPVIAEHKFGVQRRLKEYIMLYQS